MLILNAEPEVGTYTAADQDLMGNRETLLKRLGLNSEELQDLLAKFADFQRELNPAQVQVLARSLPNLERASKSLGSKPEDLTELFLEESDLGSDVVISYFQGTDGIGWPIQ